MTDYPVIEDLGDRVVIRGDLGGDVVWGLLWDGTENIQQFHALFTIDDTDYLGDPKESFYQGMLFTRVITRKSDGQKFGYSFWYSPGNDVMEGNDEQDWEELGLEIEYDDDYNIVGERPYVFLPVREFHTTGYEVLATQRRI